MKTEDLIKKLENSDLPDIKLPDHKARLKSALVNWHYRTQKTGILTLVFKKGGFALTGVAAVFLIVVFLFQNTTQLTLANARKITEQNPQIMEYIQNGAEIKDIKIIDGKAYALITPKEPADDPFTLTYGNTEKTAGVVAEIGLKEGKVRKIEKVSAEITPLSQEEKKTAENLIKNSAAVLRAPSLMATQEAEGEAKIEKVESLQAGLELVRTDHTFKAQTIKQRELKARVIYKSGEEKKESIVNITEGKVEQTKTIEVQPF